ncbi:hypothetical protein SAMN04490202_3478 [Pseudomonas reinekei]|jgi:hypothetical protein|uniref:Uncharacterized protein n=1 Tax=Pseudomonas reinekei TaxID=395598 RepID=A0A1H0R9K4_PSERE|nr:hypothetical protein [Pseudomonas reinekei]KAB0483402.1 hypothetical protein F7R15_21340 [Pseudomonas reinekei]OLU00538.1 hypothetical protein BVK86_21645 [Pseudomonas reinekei]SDP25618.1 hypothetical protein SAMN04490202_3478 [Pseudomonas reinekei]
MQNMDASQSFTAQLFVNGTPVALAGKVLQKKLEAPDISEYWSGVFRRQMERVKNMLSYGEEVVPETFLFAHHDGVYTIKVADENGQFVNSASMEGELRNLTVFEGTDPTYFHIINGAGDSVKLDNLPEALNKIRLHTGPQRREVHTYGDEPNFPTLTDLKDRGGRLVFFELKILERGVRQSTNSK